MDILAANKNMAGGGSGVVIHVIDTGVNPVSELAGVLTVVKFLSNGKADSGGSSDSGGLSDGIRDPFGTYDYSDRENHGTMMAVCAHRQAPAARIYGYCALPDGVRSYVVEALNYIFEHLDTTKRHIVSMSFRGQGNLTDAYPTAMHNAIKRLVDAGVACVCASGNDYEGTLDKYPACFEEPFTVAAVENDGKHAGFSNWPNETDFAELGVGVPCCDMNGRKDSASGTSPATAVVAGKLAAMWSKAPTLTEPQLYEAAIANAQDLGLPGRDPYFGWGWIASVEPQAAPKPEPEPEPDKPSIGGKLTAAQLVAYFQMAVAEGWGYVWSLNGELYTRELAEYYHKIKRDTNKNRDPKTYWLTDCARWIGKMAADCSGGIVGAIRTVDPSYIDRTANLFFAQCTDSGKISTIPEIPGLCVWRDGHIGIYEGNGNVLEFRGTDYGAVRTKLKDRNFTHWGRLGDIKYNTEDIDMAKVIRITSPIVYDADVQALQAALNALGYDCGTADGKAGAKTMAGIAAFCEAHGAAGEVVEVPAELPNALTLAVEIGGKKYALEVKAV